MLRRNLGIVAILGAAFAVAVAFENCSQGGFSGTSSSDSLSLVSSDTSNDPTPFAYDALFDEVSYNSCFGNGTNNPGYYTLQAGAYDSGSGGGVNVRGSFFQYAQTNLKPLFPATSISPNQIEVMLSNSAINAGAAPQFAIRSIGAPTVPLTIGGATPVQGTDFNTMLGSLTDDRWANPLVSSQASSLFFDLAPTNGRILEGSLNYTKDSPTAQSIRNALSASAMLTLTFSGATPNPGYAPRQVASNDPTRVYGHGYITRFASQISPFTTILNTYAGGAPAQGNPEQMTSISEVDMTSPATVIANWTCPTARQYVVVRAADARTICPADNFGDLVNGIAGVMSAAQYRRELEVVRRHLKAEYWDVSVERRCVVPKTGSCYSDADAESYTNSAGQTVSPVPIQYDQSQPCFRPDVPSTNGAIPIAWCAQYVSFCTREAN